jgi:triosephosphate isomerase (TIM)
MRSLIFAANWKMHVTPADARAFLSTFLGKVPSQPGRALWFFPSAVAIEAVATAVQGRTDVKVGAQNVYWEPKGAYTGETSIGLAAGAGATGALVGHSERRHVFGETDAETGRKVKALLAAGLTPMLCVGEKLPEREAGETEKVCVRQLRAALDGLGTADLAKVLIAYEPVWAIGTGKNATPADASAVHRAIRAELKGLGAHGHVPVLYGGSVNPGNAAALLAEAELDGVLVGGASLDPVGWESIVSTK